MNYWDEQRLVSSDKINPIKKTPSEFLDKKTGATYKGFIGVHASLDAEPFVKIFFNKFEMIASLSSAGMKVFFMVVWILKEKKETTFIMLDRRAWQDYAKEMKKLGATIRLNQDTFYRGLRELKEFDFIRDGRRDGEYQVNPSIVFNGRRDKAFKREKDIERATNN